MRGRSQVNSTGQPDRYNDLNERALVPQLSCLQHCRTYYHQAAKVTELPSGKNLARMAIDEYIGKIYAIERYIKEREERDKSAALKRAWQSAILHDEPLVGLSARATFRKGGVTEEFFAALVRICMNPWEPAVAAGRHACSLCRFSGGPTQLMYRNVLVTLGTSNVFVPADDVVFVAPTTVVHYIDAHEYLSPNDFQRAVLRCPEMKSRAYLKGIKAHGLSRARPGSRRVVSETRTSWSAYV